MEYVLIFVRKDLGPVQRVVQASHAALGAGNLYSLNAGQTHLKIFEVEDELQLMRIWKDLTIEGFSSFIFFEPDSVDPVLPGYSAFATEPILKEELPDLYRFKLLT